MSIDVEGMIERLQPQIEKQLSEEMTKQVVQSLSWALESKVKEIASNYIEKNVMPEVLEKLAEDRNQILAGIVGSVHVACAGIGEAIAAKAAKQLANDWTVGKIAKEVFGT